MTERSEAFQDKYRAEGYAEGVIDERLNCIRSLQQIADAPDPEHAVQEKLQALTALQAKEVSARANAGRPGAAANRSGQAPTGSDDLGDKVADALEMLMFGEIRGVRA